jgi:mRNA interferase MazF
VNNDAIGTLRLKIIIPITGWNHAFAEVPWMIRLDPNLENQLSKPAAADTCQIRSVSQQRLIRQLGTVDQGTMQSISQALALVLDIEQ